MDASSKPDTVGVAGEAAPAAFPRVDVELEWALERLVSATGRPFPAGRVREAVLACSARSGHLGAVERLAHAAADLGLRATLLRASTREVLATVGAGRPAVAVGPNGWALIDDRSAGEVRVHRPGRDRADWMGPRAVARWLLRAELNGEGLDTADAAETVDVEWLLVDPSTPLEAARAAPGHDGGAPGPFRRLAALLHIERADVATVLVFAAGVGVLGLATPIAVQSLVNTVAFGTLIQPLVVLVAVLVVVLGFAAVLQVLEFWVVELIQRRLFVRLVADLGNRLPRVDLAHLGDRHLPEVMNRFFDLFSVQKTLAFLLLDTLAIVLTALTGMIVLAFYHPYLLAFDLALVAGVLALVLAPVRSATRTAVLESKKKYKVAAWFEEVASHLATFKHGGAAEHQRYQAETLAREYLDARKGHFRLVLRQVIAALALQTVASAALLGIGGWLVIERELTLGQLVAAELIVATVVGSLAKLGKHLESFYDLLASVDKVGQLLDLPTERDGGDRFHERGAAGSRAELRGVELGFGRGAARLRVESLAIRPGETVALTGPSGEGKSTLLDALFGLRAPKSGRLEVDGADVRDLRLDELRARVALVRGADVFRASVAENVRIGRPNLSLAEVRDALSRVGLYDEVAALPDGLSTELGSDGRPLSQGQLLRLAVARAVAGRPSMVLVDDVLDRLDPSERAHAFDALAGAGGAKRTLLVVTSSPDVLRRCDRVLRVAGGRIVEETAPFPETA